MKQKVETGKINENTYLIDVKMFGVEKITSMFAVKGEKTLLIDGGTSSEAPEIMGSLKNLGLLPVDYIVISHSHWDHHQAIPALLGEMPNKKVELLAHPKALPVLEDPSKAGYDFGVGPLLPIKGVNPIKEGDVLDIGGLELEVIYTPGHTIDCISLLDSKNRNMFVSDAVVDKIDETTCIPPLMPPSFDPNAYISTLEKLGKYDFQSICLGHYGMYYGQDVKDVLDEAKSMYERVWNFFGENIDRLDDIEWVANSLIKNYMPNSKTIERTGMTFALAVVRWLIDGYKMCKKL
jgi:glyoxylase-like metal-dependent hydrolase (beta-lactamase superfamily II)